MGVREASYIAKGYLVKRSKLVKIYGVETADKILDELRSGTGLGIGDAYKHMLDWWFIPDGDVNYNSTSHDGIVTAELIEDAKPEGTIHEIITRIYDQHLEETGGYEGIALHLLSTLLQNDPHAYQRLPGHESTSAVKYGMYHLTYFS